MLDLPAVDDCWHDALDYVSHIFQRGNVDADVYPAPLVHVPLPLNFSPFLYFVNT